MMKMLALSAAFGLAAVAMTMPPAQNPVELKVGDQAPDFELPGSDGRTWRLNDLRGRTVVLAWFPKAFTGG